MQSNHRKILNMPVAVTSYDNAVQWVLESVKSRAGKYVCVANVHMCMEAFDDAAFCNVLNNADLVVPDGKPLSWGLRLLGEKSATQVRGADIMLRLCREAESKKHSIGLYGGTLESLDDLVAFLYNKFPALKISFASSPPFRPLTVEEDQNYINEINKSGAEIVFVGIGCPKQENWMAAHKDKLSCVMLGVGAAFDFFSGRKKHAPRWMQNFGLEWVFRLANDPKRLWKRYLKHNPRFIWYFGKQWLGAVFAKKK